MPKPFGATPRHIEKLHASSLSQNSTPPNDPLSKQSQHIQPQPQPQPQPNIMESFHEYVDSFFANDLLSYTILSSAILVFIFSCLWLICDGPNDGHFDQLEDHNSANGAVLFLVSLTVCISSLAGLEAYLQHGAEILKWANEISSDDVFVSAVAVLFIALGIFVLIAEFQKRGAVLPILHPVEEQVEVSPLEVAVEDFVLHCFVTTFTVTVGVLTLPGYTVKVLCRSLLAFVNGS